MMMDHLPSLECVPVAVRDKPRYVGDHIIRHYRPLGLAALLRDLGADPATPELVITGGIGRLTLRADGETWEPTLPGAQRPPPPPRPADPALATVRRTACASCESWTDHCTAAGCGCAGEGRPEVWSSICPHGRWPLVQLPVDNRPPGGELG
jgi:hypothetical protein